LAEKGDKFLRALEKYNKIKKNDLVSQEDQLNTNNFCLKIMKFQIFRILKENNISQVDFFKVVEYINYETSAKNLLEKIETLNDDFFKKLFIPLLSEKKQFIPYDLIQIMNEADEKRNDNVLNDVIIKLITKWMAEEIINNSNRTDSQICEFFGLDDS